MLKEADGSVSLIRIFDRYSVAAPTPQSPQQPLPLNLVIMMRSGIFRGPATIKIKATSPSGTDLPTLEFPVHFEGDDERATLLAMNIGFTPPEQGLYWFDVVLDEKLVTRIPLRVVFQRMGPVTAQPPQQ